jgi:hypothetical protein
MSSGEAAVPIFGSFLSRVPHRKDEIGTPQGVSIVEVEAASGLVWQPGCGPSVIEAFLAGTEPRQQCGGYYNGMQDLSIYTEPPMLSDEMAAQMAMYDSLYRVQPIEDPDLADMSMVDTATEVDDDTVVVDTPMVAPPRDTLRVPRPVLRDTIIDSLSTSDSLPHASLR